MGAFMKLDDVRKLATAEFPHTPEGQRRVHAYLQSIGIDPANVYQELEMSSPFVNTHRDTTFSSVFVSLHSHSYFEILYCLSASDVEYLVGPDRYKLQKGDIILIPPGISHRPILPEKLTTPYVRDVLWVNADFLASLKENLPYTTIGKEHTALIRTAGTRWEFLGDLFQSGIREEEQRFQGWEAIVLGNTLKILAYLDRACGEHGTDILKAEKPELLDKVTAYIENHYAEHITVSELAHKFYVSDSTISHLFKQKMGISIYHYITQRRLISAKNLISNGLALEQVATRVGFSDYSSFYRAFKQEYGISPRQYRNLQEKGR